MKYEIVLTSSFKKDLKTIQKRHKDINKLTKIVNLLAENIKLDKKYKDYALVNSTDLKIVENAI